MALLTAAQIDQVWSGVMRRWSRAESNENTGSVNKNDLKAAISALNTYLDGASGTRPATSINAAFPAASQSGLSTGQKGQLVAYVALAQTGNINDLRQLLGDID